MTKFCPNCGKEVSSKFCPFCGFDMRQLSDEAPAISFEPEAPAAPETETSAPEVTAEPAPEISFDAAPQPAPEPQQNYNTYYIPPQQQKEPVTHRTWFVILFLLIFWPLGLFFMWRAKKFNKVARIIITAVIGILFIINIIGLVALGNASDDYYDDYDDYDYSYESDDYWDDSSSDSSFSGSQIIDGETAYECAQGYLNALNFSREGLIEQLEYEGYSLSEATSAVDSLVVDWNQQAAGSAQSYLRTFPDMTRSELIDQLEYEGFTYSQAVYGADAVGL